MHLLIRLAAACSLAAVALVTGAAQQRDSIPAGDASVAGRVIDRDSQRPLEHAIVTLTGFDGKRVLKTLSDGNGRYVFESIASGSYYVVAFLEGYGSLEYRHGDAAPGNREPIHVSQGRPTTGIDLLMRRSGTITGRVTRSGGDPVPDAFVTSTLMLDRTLFITGMTQARTDSQGQYTIRNVPAGSHRVSARWLDPDAMKARGVFDGRPTYFPGTENAAEAASITVGVAETVSGIDISLAGKELLRISGHVLRAVSEGPIEANLLASGWYVRPVAIAEDGAFDLTHLTPGRYTFWARGRTADGYEAAVMTVDLGSPMTGLSMPLYPTGGVSGRVMSDDGTPLPAGLQVAALQADESRQLEPLERDRSDVGENGRFDVRGLFGERILRVLGLGPEWDVDRVMRARSPAPSLTIVPGEQIDDVTIVLKRR